MNHYFKVLPTSQKVSFVGLILFFPLLLTLVIANWIPSLIFVAAGLFVTLMIIMIVSVYLVVKEEQ